jgi:putative endonuclease
VGTDAARHPPVRAKDALGRFGEDVAAEHLVADGCVLLDRNWRCRAGELDVVARDGNAVVFCEVKSRSSVRFGLPVEAVTPVKARRQRALAAQWLAAHRDDAGAGAVRFDVVGVLAAPGQTPRVTHLKAIF